MITYNGIDYPTREVDLGEPFGIVTVATKTLSNTIIDNWGSPVDREAEDIDCDVFFYVDDDMLASPELVDYILKNI